MSDVRHAPAGMETIQVRVAAVGDEAQEIRSYELRPTVFGALPPFTAGAHVDLHLPNGLVRSYSICNDAHESGRYVVCVNKEPTGRGGSAFLHDNVSLGDILAIGKPRNHFSLAENVEHSVLIAGGIGITPLWSMIQRLERIGRSWQLYYAARSRQRAAFLDRLKRFESRVADTACNAAASMRRQTMHFRSTRDGDPRFDLFDIVRLAPSDAHFYCCGPTALLRDFEAATVAIAPERVHVEYFAAAPPASSTSSTSSGQSFTVELAQSGCDVEVPSGTSILDALLDVGIQVPYICKEGVCGTCETRVLSGIPDHRDQILSRHERDAGRVMMICCSGSKTPRLRLDR
jgi:ferredoxin-NADP reductase